MSVKLGEVLSPDTNLYVQLFGEEGETSKIMLRPVGSSLNKFEKGRMYKFTVETVNIGKVSNEMRLYRRLVYAMQCFLQEGHFDNGSALQLHCNLPVNQFNNQSHTLLGSCAVSWLVSQLKRQLCSQSVSWSVSLSAS